MEYFSNPIHISLLRNHINNDPIIDWFEVENYKNKIFEKDKNNFFRKYILNYAIEYKNNFINNLRNKILQSFPDIINYNYVNSNETVKLLEKRAPIIINPILINKKYNISVSVDIIIKKELFMKLFPLIENVNLHNINGNDYMIINILPEIVNFKSGCKELQKNEIIKYNECKLYVFNSALKQHMYRGNIGFILAKDYKYKNNLLDKKKNIGLVKFDDSIRMNVINAIDWIYRVRSKKYKIIDNEPETIELFPNMNFKNTEYQDEKKKISEKIKEITLVWRISYRERCELVKNNIKTWDNIYLLNNLYDFKDTNVRKIQEKMIHMNIQNDLILSSRTISGTFQSAINPGKNDYVLDIESLIHLEEQSNYFNNIITEDKANICIIGSVYLKDNNYVSYKDFTINNLDLLEEKKIVINWVNSLVPNDNGFVKIFHWGHAEKTYINYMKCKYKDIIFPRMILIDLCEFFINEPLLLKGCFNFGLKNIGKCLYKNKLIKTTWSDTDNGLDAMILFKDICEKNSGKNIPIKRYTEISEIVEYNKIDCIVLMEILQFLRERFL